jgi:hypothetical protein
MKARFTAELCLCNTLFTYGELCNTLCTYGEVADLIKQHYKPVLGTVRKAKMLVEVANWNNEWKAERNIKINPINWCEELSLLMVQTVSISETSVNFCESSRRNIPEDSRLHIHRLKELSSQTQFVVTRCSFRLYRQGARWYLTCRCLYSGQHRNVDLWEYWHTNVLEEHTVYIFRAEDGVSNNVWASLALKVEAVSSSRNVVTYLQIQHSITTHKNNVDMFLNLLVD